LAALAFATYGPSISFLLDAASFLVSALILTILIRPEPTGREKTPMRTSIRSGLADARDSIRGIPEAVGVLARNRLALGMMIASYGVTFTAGVNSFGLIFLLDDELGLPAEALGVVLSWNALIAVVAALLVGIFVKWVKVRSLFLTCLVFFVIAQFVMGAAPNIVVLLVGVGVSALVNAPYNVAVTSLFQTSVEDEHLGRIGGLDEMAENIIQVIVFLSAGIIVATAGPRLALVGAGVVALLLLCVGAMLMRGLEPRDDFDGSEDPKSASAARDGR
jgi:MFS family permease